ncbi:MAG: phospho-sugar mutase [Leptospirales bacterium]|nr:phospho-sugar mutase [Leptospirales bacterium]
MTILDLVKERAYEWTKAPYDEECRDEIKGLIDTNNDKELTERFAIELEFGTGGLRGLIRNGTNGMNRYVVARATQGLANYVNKSGSGKHSAAIAYDSRFFSKEFAMESANVFASNGIKTYIFSEMRPTPELSFAVREFKCTTGIVITASHNPKEYNGYKVYWNDGAQVVSPHDTDIIDEVRKIERLEDVKRGDFDSFVKSGMVVWIGEEVDEKFMKEVVVLASPKVIENSSVKIVYTPLHGTGSAIIPKVLSRVGFKDVIYVDEQMKADPAFSTVRKPNPEERDALDLAIKYAVKNNADIVVATDPDADRMGIAVKNSSGEFDVLSGNHIGAILEYYILSKLKENNSLPRNGAVVKTIVTTDLQDKIAESFSMKVFNVLTGFKYIGEKIKNFEETGEYKYVFGGEESYGYLAGTYSRDKDSVAATLLISECCAYLKNKGLTLTDYLNSIFKEYGFYNDKSVSIDAEGLKGLEVINEVMRKLKGQPYESIGGADVVKAIDYMNDTIFDADGSAVVLPKSNVLQYKLSDGSIVTVRPSGTEPKIKFYFSAKSASREETDLKLNRMIDDIIPGIKAFMEKSING